MSTKLQTYKLVLGLEIHIHVKTTEKMFCGCDADVYGKEPNSHTCPTCLGLPGALPVPNGDAVRKTQRLGLALNCKLNEKSRFDRKHYFYPDLPKGYQISQYKQPLCEEGYLELSTGKKIDIERVHLEEDTAKSFHEGGKTLIDFNVSGMPLIEIVTKPVLTSPEEAVEFAKRLRDLAKYLNISDADMEKGQMRIEPNISLRTEAMEKEAKLPDYKVEVKNINSFRFMSNAVKYEIDRQTELLASGQQPVQENRGWDEKSGTTISQREKEEAHDYRYFPEPDIPPMSFSEEYLDTLGKELPELPWVIKDRLVADYKLSAKNADALTTGLNIELLPLFENFARLADPELVANLLLNKPEVRELTAAEFTAKVTEMANKVDDKAELEKVISEVLAENKSAVDDYKTGKDNALQFLLGKVMQKTQGKADAQVTMTLLKDLIS